MRKIWCVLAITGALLLTGCATDVPDLSHVDNNLAGQYMADSLLKYDKNYTYTIDYDRSLLEPTPEPTPEPEPEEESAEETNTARSDEIAEGGEGATVAKEEVSLSDLYGVSGVTVKANSYQVKNSYGTDYASYTAKSGKTLLIVHFTVSNNSKSEKKVDLQSANVSAGLSVNGTNQGSALLSIVDGDMQYFNEKIAAGKKKQGVLLFEIDKNLKVDNVELTLSTDQAQSTVSVH